MVCYVAKVFLLECDCRIHNKFVSDKFLQAVLQHALHQLYLLSHPVQSNVVCSCPGVVLHLHGLIIVP